jgi:hypothetical protein
MPILSLHLPPHRHLQRGRKEDAPSPKLDHRTKSDSEDSARLAVANKEVEPANSAQRAYYNGGGAGSSKSHVDGGTCLAPKAACRGYPRDTTTNTWKARNPSAAAAHRHARGASAGPNAKGVRRACIADAGDVEIAEAESTCESTRSTTSRRSRSPTRRMVDLQV